MKSSLELTWIQLLEKGYVYGIPSFFNGKFLDRTPKKDIKSIQRGFLHRFPTTLRKQFLYLKERSHSTSGIRVEFSTDAQSIQIFSKITKIKHRENFSNMAQGCMDLLVDGKFWVNYYPRWHCPDRIIFPNDHLLHRISLVFPNYAGLILHKIVLHNVENLSNRIPPFLLENKPIVYYGTSITQGGCASRPALAYSHQLSEIFCMNYVNLSISGQARGEPEMARFIASFKHAALFILDWGANLIEPPWKGLLEERYEQFWRIIFEQNPHIPILFVGLQNYSYDVSSEPAFRSYIQQKRDFIKNTALKACHEINSKSNRKKFDFLDGTSIINTSTLGMTLDGVHPNDLGHKIYAELLEWKIIELLGNHIHS